MENIINLILIILFTSCTQEPDNSFTHYTYKKNVEEKRYFSIEEFNDNFEEEIKMSQRTYWSLKNVGLKEFQFCTFDFDFVSDKKEKLDYLAEFLKQNNNFETFKIYKHENEWVLEGNAFPFPVDSLTLKYWSINMYSIGYNFDCKLFGYGAMIVDSTYPDLSKDSADFYFDEGLKAYNKNNKFEAILNWTTVLKINPKDTNAYYSRAIVLNELNLWEDAHRDYDKAIEIAPHFTDAFVNRGTLKDEKGLYYAAISDYDKAIEIDSKNAMVYFNRGNSYFNLDSLSDACLDWKKAKELGVNYANDSINKYCK